MKTRSRSDGPTIFLAVPAYRDPDLVPTVENCIANAVRPGALRFGICWQRDPSDPMLPFAGDRRFRFLEYDWHESKGIGWARAECMSLFGGEDFYLQLDSHHRFVPEWDEKLIRCAELTGSSKPVLTSFAMPFSARDPDVVPTELPTMNFGRWDGNMPLFRPGIIAASKRLARPIRARSISAHFCFSIGDFVRDVPCDPELFYYGADEITVAVRAFTSGYDLFHPPEPILSHAYAGARADRNTYWGDHADWWKQSNPSKARVAEFLTNPHTEQFGCGTERTMADYEAYAGLSFRHCRAQNYTHMNEEPPNPSSAPDWPEEPQDWSVRLTLKPSGFPSGFVEADSWTVRLSDALGGRVYNETLDRSEVSRLLVDGASPPIELRFESSREPAAWSVHADREGPELSVRGLVGRSTDHGQAVIDMVSMT